MADFFAERMGRLGFSLPEGDTPPSEELVREFEGRFDLELPRDFRAFLARFGGCKGTAHVPMLEPTPFGRECGFVGFYGFHEDEIGDATDLIEGAPDVIALGGEPMGKMFWLHCSEPYAGHVWVHDHQGRSAWSDADFLQWFPNLHPDIRAYLDLRKGGRLPKKPRGFEHVYLAAHSFTEFLERLHPDSTEE